MRRWLAAMIVIGAFLWWIALMGPAGDLRKFDPDAVAAAETAMWRSYYSRERMRLFIQLVQLLREQYLQPAPKAILTAFHAARAASTFQSGHSRAEYVRALPDLVDYFSRLLPPGADLEPVARLELEWWILHRERHPRLAPALAELQAAIYSLPAEKFREHAALRAEAMIIRDRRAERGELTEEDWRQINDLLRRSWRSLHAAVNLNPAVGATPALFSHGLQAVAKKPVSTQMVKCAAVEIPSQFNDLGRSAESRLPFLG